MNNQYLKKWVTGLLCATLIFTNVLSTGIQVSAAETGADALVADEKPDEVLNDESEAAIEEDENVDNVAEVKEDQEENEGKNEAQDTEGLDENQDEPKEDVSDTETPDENSNESEAGGDESEMQDEEDTEVPEEESKVSEEIDDLENEPMAAAVEYAVIGDDYPAKYKNAAADTIIDEWKFYNRECTSFVAWRLNSRNGVNFTNYYGGPRWSNARYWAGIAQSLGITVDSNPAVGAVAWWDGGSYIGDNLHALEDYGHVAWVSSVDGDNVTIEEYNGKNAYAYCSRTISKTIVDRYIHIADIPDPIPQGSEMSSGYDQTIPNGDYQIISFRNPNFQLDIAGNDIPAATWTNVWLWEAESSVRPQDVFTITYDSSDKFYSIIQKDTNMSLDIADTSAAAGANVQVYPYHGGSAQRWAISEAWDDSGNWIGYRIQAKCSGFSLDVAGGDLDSAYVNGTNIQQWLNNTSQAQSWLFIPYEPQHTLEDGRYILVSGLGQNLELDIAGDSNEVENGANVQVWNDDSADFRNNALSQYNSFDVRYLGEGYYKLYHAGSGKTLDISGASKNLYANAQIWDNLDSSHAQQWAITPLNNGYALRVRSSGLALDIDGGSTANGTNVQQYSYNGSLAQTWYFVPAGHTVTYDANGGIGAPESQTKYYKGNLTLSDRIPTRSGYTFLGWATDQDSPIPEYNAGGIYTADTSITLYAIWRNETDPSKEQFNISTSWEDGGKLSIAITVPINKTASANLVAALYDQNGKVLDVKCRNVELSAGETFTTDMSFSLQITNDTIAKVFLLDRQNGLAPLCQNATISRFGATSGMPAVQTAGEVPNATPETFLMPIEGKYSYTYQDAKSGNMYALLVVAGIHEVLNVNTTQESDLLYIDQKSADSDKVSFNGFIPMEDKNATVFITGEDIGAVSIGYLVKDFSEFDEVLPEDVPKNGIIPEGLWIAGITEGGYSYTGSAIKPEVRVYDYKTLLKEKTDYTIAYKNNTKANDASVVSNAPTITVTGKGNYSGRDTKTFKIFALDISEGAADSLFEADDIVVAYSSKAQKPMPALLWNGKNLKNKTDYTYTYHKGAYKGTDTEEIVSVKEAGSYYIKLTGTGNFTGTRRIKLTVLPDNASLKPLSKATVKKIANQSYQTQYAKGGITPEVTAKYGSETLTPGIHYTVSYSNNTKVGTAYAIIKGIEKNGYSGTKRVSFKITGIAVKKATVKGLSSQTFLYSGVDIKPDLTLSIKVNGQERTMVPGTDYKVAWQNNQSAGNATAVITGLGGYTGTVKKTFKIQAFNVAENTGGRFLAVLENDTVPYAKGGAKPTLKVTFTKEDGTVQTLTEGKDYTLTYKNNTAVNDGSNANKLPTVTIKGKGSFSGTYAIKPTYRITPQNIGNLVLSATDKVYQNKKNIYTTKVTITDLNGKTLKARTDYDQTFTYVYKNDATLDDKTVRRAGTTVGKNDIIPAGTILEVAVSGKNNYTGTITGEYRITQKSISGASVSIPKQTYTGQAVTLSKDQITVKVKGEQLAPSQYEIVSGSYKNNVKKGTASVTIKGVGNYGGTKTVKFSIRAKGFLWW